MYWIDLMAEGRQQRVSEFEATLLEIIQSE